MSLLRRIISPAYRRAVAAEAEGNYLLAARSYALCGLSDKVAEMHILEASRLGTSGAKLEELRAAVRWLGSDTPLEKGLLRRISAAFLAVLRQGPLTEAERVACREAAQLALRAGDPLGAAEAFELCGDRTQAAEAYREAGEIERMEALLDKDERAHTRQALEREHFEQYQMCLSLGRRADARRALEACLETSTSRAEPRRLLDDLSARLIRNGRVTLRRTTLEGDGQEGEPLTYIGEAPVLLGRGSECAVVLRDAGVSRCHARIRVGPEVPGQAPVFLVCDLESKNGTTLRGLALAGEVPLSGRGEIGIGDQCVISFEVREACLDLRMKRGVERGKRILVSPRPIALEGSDDDSDHDHERGAGATLSFEDGTPCLSSRGGVVLNGRRSQEAVELIRGDLVVAGRSRFEVVG